MNRKIKVAGNWKMNLSYQDAMKLTGALSKQVSSSRILEVVVCPPFPYLVPMLDQLRVDNSDIAIGAQNCHDRESGAFTGEVSASMLASCGVKYVILGHSERRAQFGEDSELLKDKLSQALDAELHVMYCVGELLEQREAGEERRVVGEQIREVLGGLSQKQFSYITIAYEPVWAIGTGRTASPAQAQEMHAYIRSVVEELFGSEVSSSVSILYGGSVKPANALELFQCPDVDGGLVGGASLDEHHFIAIVRAAQSSL